MGTVTTVTVAPATAYGNQRRIERTSNGVLWAIVTRTDASSVDPFALTYSTDNGVTWISAGTLQNGSGSSTATYFPNVSLKCDEDDVLTVAFKDNANGYIYVRRGVPSNAARTAYTWSAASTVRPSTDCDYPDVVIVRDPATVGAWVGLVVMSVVGSVTTKVLAASVSVAAGGTISVGGATSLGAGLATANNNPAYASVDFNHTGDGKTVKDGLPHWYVGWSAGATGAGYGIRFRKATYASGSWTWGIEREIDNTRYSEGAFDTPQTMWDGNRVAIVMEGYRGRIYERDAADATTITRLSVDLSTGNTALNYGTASYDSAGNIYLFGAVESGVTRNLAYRKWDRASGVLGPRVTITNSVQFPYVSARRGSQGQAIDYVWTDGTASPYTVTSGRIVLNQNPTAPTPVSPTDNATWDSAADQTVTLGYSDPDGDAASKARVCYRPKGTTGPYAVLEVTTSIPSGGTVNIPIPANTWAGDVTWYGQAADASGSWSSPSATRTLTGIPTSLAAASGGTGGTEAKALAIANRVEAERSQRTGGRSALAVVATASPLTITVDGSTVSALRNGGYTPAANDTVQATYIGEQWVVQDKVV